MAGVCTARSVSLPKRTTSPSAHRGVDGGRERLGAPDLGALVDLFVVGQVLVAFGRGVQQLLIDRVHRDVGVQGLAQAPPPEEWSKWWCVIAMYLKSRLESSPVR